MGLKTCAGCKYGSLEKTSHNGSPPKFRQACDFLPNFRNYPTKPCVYWREAEGLIDLPGDAGNQT